MPSDITNAKRAEILTQALPYIQKYYGKVIVIKYGGNAMISPELNELVMEDIVLMSLIGIKVVLVHGGGPEINETLGKMGIESRFIDGLRVTDADTVSVVQMVLAGKINKNLVNLLEMNGGRAVGLSGIDGRMISAEKKDDRLGYVGTVTDVDASPIIDMLEKGYIPVVSTLGCDKSGNVYNINADTAAARIAAAVNAERLITLTDICGILRDREDPSTLIPEMDISMASELMTEGVISGGMIPKVECCIDAVNRGVGRVIILDGRIPHAILLEILTDEGAGTMISKEIKYGR